MKNISLLVLTAVVLSLFSCHNEDPSDRFEDFEYTTVYFPYQYPVRTLVLGDYSIDNTNDKNLKFMISARVAGLYENENDWNVTYEIDPSLAAGVTTSANSWDGKAVPSADPLEILPAQYYSLNPDGNFTIPAGQFYGEIEVQLTDAFLDDPKAFLTRYVIPVRITSSSADSVLSGTPATENPDPRAADDWNIPPKNFTLFGIKFVNAYHGKYLHRGKSVITDDQGDVTQTIVYHERFVVDDEIWALQTSGRNTVTVTGVLRSAPASPGDFIMDLTFDSNGDCVISASADSPFPVTGTGKFVKDGDSWGNKERDAIHLNYAVTEGTNTHTITDTLVFRDKGIAFQEFEPVLVP